MQAVTHLAIGAALGSALPRHRLLAAGLAALSHPLVDDLALSTYHPPEALWDDPFWVGFHVLAYAGAALVAVVFRHQAWVMLAAMAPDLDWLVARPLGLWEPGALHALFRAIPGISFVSAGLRASLPDLRLYPPAALVEIGLTTSLLAYAWRRRAVAGRGA